MQLDFLNSQDANTQEAALKIEALIFASEKALDDKALRQLLSLDQPTLEKALSLIDQKLSLGALELMKTASGYRMQVRQEFAPLITALWPERENKLSQALLETLSIIAYKQPVTRADIEQIRGVSTSSAILRQLFDKGWISEKGFRDLPGRPALLHTTQAFLDAFCLRSLSELPELPALKEPAVLETN